MLTSPLFRTAVALAATLASFAAHSAPVIDQNAPANNALMAFLYQGDIAQSFKQTANNIAGAGFFTSAGFPAGNITYSLFDTLGGSLLATASGAAGAGGWVDLFWDPVSIVPETTYYLVVTGTSEMGLQGDILNNYSRGQTYANPGFQEFSSYDYTFRTYSGEHVVVGVPEPTSLLLAAAGLASLSWVRRRKSI